MLDSYRRVLAHPGAFAVSSAALVAGWLLAAWSFVSLSPAW